MLDSEIMAEYEKKPEQIKTSKKAESWINFMTTAIKLNPFLK